MATRDYSRHLVKSLVASQILKAFHSPGELLRLRDVVSRTGLSKGIAFKTLQSTLERTRKHLRETQARHILVGAANHSSALRALRAFQEAGRASECSIAGQKSEPEARETPLDTPPVDCVDRVFPGEVRIWIFWANRVVPPAVFTSHQIITPQNVDHFYANDSLLSSG